MATETTRIEGIYEIRIEQGPALREFEKLNKQLANTRVLRTELNKQVRESIKAEESLARQIEQQGSATDEQTQQLAKLRSAREDLNRKQSEAVLTERALSAQTRELSNDLAGLTENGLRFRDKMAEATRQALEGSQVFQQWGNRSQFLSEQIRDNNAQIDRQAQEISALNAALASGEKTQAQYTAEMAALNAQIESGKSTNEALQRELDGVNEKSKRLETEIAQLSAEFKAGKISQEQYRAGLRAIEDETSRAANATITLSDKFDAFTKNQAGELRSNLSSLALQYVGVGAAVEGVRQVIGSAIDTVVEFDRSLSRIKALGGEYAANIGQIGEAAKTAGVDFGFTATQSLSAVEALAKAGVTSEQILSGGLTGALTLAASGTLDVGQAAEIAANAMTQFGLQGEDVTHIADLLAAGANSATGEVGDFAFALKQSGLVASQAGIGIEETVGTLTAFASAGLLGSDAGTSFRTMLLRLSKPTEESAAAMERLGIAAFDSEGAFVGIESLAGQLQSQLSGLTDEQRQNALATIFGSDAIRAASVLYEQGSEGIANYTKTVNQSGFAQKVAAEQTNNLRGDLDKAKAGWEAFVLSIEDGSGTIGSAFRSLVQGFTQELNALANADGFLEFTQILQPGGAAMITEREATLKRIAAEANNVADAQKAAIALAQDLAAAELRGDQSNAQLIRQKITLLRQRAFVLQATAKTEVEAEKQSTDAAQDGAKKRVAAAETVAQARERIKAALESERAAQGNLAATDAAGLAASQARIDALERESASLEGKTAKVVALTEKQREQQALEAEMAALANEAPTAITPIAPGQVAADGVTPLASTEDRLATEAANNQALLELYDQEKVAYQEVQQAKIDAAIGFTNALRSVAGESSGIAKALLVIEKGEAIAAITIQTQKAIATAQAQAASVSPFIPPGIPNPAFAVAQSIAAAQILKLKIGAGVSIAQIAAQAITGFAEGGEISGDVKRSWGTPVTRPNGDNLLVRADRGFVTLKTGEKVLNKEQQYALESMTHKGIWGDIGLPGYQVMSNMRRSALGYADGGTIGTIAPTPSPVAIAQSDIAAQMAELANRPIVASWAEGMEVGQRIEFRETRAAL